MANDDPRLSPTERFSLDGQGLLSWAECGHPILPVDTWAEEALIGSLLVTCSAGNTAALRHLHVGPEHFFFPFYAQVLQAMLDLDAQGLPVNYGALVESGLDLAQLADVALDLQATEVPWWRTVHHLADDRFEDIPPAERNGAPATTFARLLDLERRVWVAWEKRRLLDLAQRIAEAASDLSTRPGAIYALVKDAQQHIPERPERPLGVTLPL